MRNRSDHHHCGNSHTGPGRGPTSFFMHDPEAVFKLLALKKGDRVLDLGSGPGDYSLKAVELVGEEGSVFALDREKAAVMQLGDKAMSLGLGNLNPVQADITKALPVEDGSIDICLISTVLHIFAQPKFELPLYGEIKRVLKLGGRLAVIECHKKDQPWGPPLHMRISPDEMREGLAPHGFQETAYQDLGKTYLMVFTLA